MPLIAIAANSAWNVVNFRSGLIRALQAQGLDVAVIAPDGPEADKVRALDATFNPIAIDPRGTSPLDDLTLMRSFGRHFRALGPAALLGFTAKPNIWGSLAAHRLRIPVINNISGLGTAFIQGGLLERLVSALYARALKRSSTVFFQNPDDRDLFVGRGLVRQGQVDLIPGSGIDLEQFAPVTPPETGDRPFTFLLPARMIWDKGVREYVEAARHLRSSGTDARFQVLGPIDPPGPQAIPQDTVKAWASSGVIDYLGAADDVRPAFAAADCIVLPSYREGTPRALLEAGAMAIPAVATDVPGCREVIEDEVTGLFCSARSAESLAQAMGRMYALSREQRAEMGRAARMRMERQFDERIVHRAYIAALQKAGVIEA